MKRNIIYILILFIMLISPVSVFAAENIKISTSEIEIIEGKTGTFDIIIFDAMARGNITVSDSSKISLVSYNSDEGYLGEDGYWVSKDGLLGKNEDHTITVNALGKAGDTATVNIVINDATDYTNKNRFVDSSNPMKFTVTVKIVEAPEPSTNYTVTYDKNGGTDAPEKQYKFEGSALILSTVKPTREGYEFIGWNTKKDGSGTSYQPGGQYDQDMDVTLYAQWKETKNAEKNPETGDTMIYIVLLLTLGALIYSYWYMSKSQEN